MRANYTHMANETVSPLDKSTAKLMLEIEKIQARINKGSEKQRKTIDAINDLFRKQAKLIAPIQKQMAQATMQVNKAFKEQSRNVRAITDSYNGLNRSLVRSAATFGLLYKSIDRIIEIAQTRLGAAILGGPNIGRLVSQSLPAGVSGQKALDVLSATLKQSQLLQFRADASQVAAINKLTGELRALPSSISGDLISTYIGTLKQSDIPKFLDAVRVDSRKAISDFANISNIEQATSLSNALSLVSADEGNNLDPLLKAAIETSKSIERLKSDFESVSDKMVNRFLPAIEKLSEVIESLSPTQTMIGAGLTAAAVIAGPSLAWNAGKAIAGTGARGMAGAGRGLLSPGGAAAGKVATGIGEAYTGVTGGASIATGLASGMVLSAPIIIGAEMYDDALAESSSEFQRLLDVDNPAMKKLLKQAEKFREKGDMLRYKRTMIDRQLLSMTGNETERNVGLFGTKILSGDFSESQKKQIDRLSKQRAALQEQITASEAITVTTDDSQKSFLALNKIVETLQNTLVDVSDKFKAVKAPALSSQPALQRMQSASLALTDLGTTLTEQSAIADLKRQQKEFASIGPFGSITSLGTIKDLNLSLDDQLKTMREMLKIAQEDNSSTGRLRQYQIQGQIMAAEIEKKQNLRGWMDALTDLSLQQAMAIGRYEAIIVQQDKNLMRGLQKGMIGWDAVTQRVAFGNIDSTIQPQQPQTAYEVMQRMQSTSPVSSGAGGSFISNNETNPVKLLKQCAKGLEKAANMLGVKLEAITDLQHRANEPSITYQRPGRTSNHIP